MWVSGLTHERNASAARYFRCSTEASSDRAYGEVHIGAPARKAAAIRQQLPTWVTTTTLEKELLISGG